MMRAPWILAVGVALGVLAGCVLAAFVVLYLIFR